MPKGHGRFQRQLLLELDRAKGPLSTAALLPRRSGYEKRRALRRLAAQGLLSEVRPDIWLLKEPSRERRSEGKVRRWRD
jgi:hypothetical protein